MTLERGPCYGFRVARLTFRGVLTRSLGILTDRYNWDYFLGLPETEIIITEQGEMLRVDWE